MRRGNASLTLVHTKPRDPAGELPPHDLEAERACLGAAIVNRAARDAVCEATAVEDFMDPAASRVREALGGLRQADAPAELVLLSRWLRDRDALEKVGGLPYLGQLVEVDACAPANARGVAQRVAGFAAARRWIASTQASAAAGYSVLELSKHAAPGDPTGAYGWITAQRRNLEAAAPAGPENLDRFAIGAIAAESQAETLAMQSPFVGAFISTGIETIDEVTGLYPNEVTMLGAEKGLGKTTLARWISERVARNPRRLVDGHPDCERCQAEQPCSAEHARQPRGVLVFALEGTRRDWSDYMAAREAKLNLFERRNGRWTHDHHTAFTRQLELLKRVPLVVDDRKDLCRANIGPRVRAWRDWFAQRGAKLEQVVLDYFQIAPWERGGDSREADLSDAGRHVIRLATDAESDTRGMSWLVITALNKDGATRESGALEYHADTVWRLSAAKKKDPLTDAKSLYLWIEKQRRGPSKIGVPFSFDPAMGRFW